MPYKQNASTRRGFYSNTYLFEGGRECFLVDAHLNAAEAQDLNTLVAATQKRLSAILITHPHPDHYQGLEVLGPKFPDTPILASAGTLDIIATASANWAGFENPLRALDDGKLSLAARDFECWLPPDAESTAPMVMFEPKTRLLVAGDHVMNGQHHWLVEGRGDAWRDNLKQILQRWPIETVLPGHGAAGGVELIEATDAYLRDFSNLKTRGLTADQAHKEMLRLYPEHVYSEALHFSTLANF